MSAPSNEARVDSVGNVIDGYRDAGRQSSKETINDLLTDLRHYCDQAGLNFPGLLYTSEYHYSEEKSEGDDDSA